VQPATKKAAAAEAETGRGRRRGAGGGGGEFPEIVATLKYEIRRNDLRLYIKRHILVSRTNNSMLVHLLVITASMTHCYVI
jgi:hypothetical protein